MLTPATGVVFMPQGPCVLGIWRSLVVGQLHDDAAPVSFFALLRVSLPVGDNVAHWHRFLGIWLSC